jgi:hypothetical protein
MKNLSDQTDLSSELLISLPIRGTQMGEVPKLGWLITFTKYAMYTNSIHFLYLLLLTIYKILASFQHTLSS